MTESRQRIGSVSGSVPVIGLQFLWSFIKLRADLNIPRHLRPVRPHGPRHILERTIRSLRLQSDPGSGRYLEDWSFFKSQPESASRPAHASNVFHVCDSIR